MIRQRGVFGIPDLNKMAESVNPESTQKTTFGFKKRGRLAQSRKRKTSDSDEGKVSSRI